LRRDPTRPIGGDNPTIKELIDYDQFCGIPPLPAEATASQARPDEVTVQDMKKALDNPSLGIKVIDVREADEYEIAKVDGVPLLTKRACLKIARGAAARDLGFGQGGEVGASPQRAVTTEPTQAKTERPAARRVFAQKTVWLRCSSVEDPQVVFSFGAPRHPAFCPKTAPLGICRQALKPDQRTLHGTRSEPAILSALQSRRAFVKGAELPAATGLQISQERQRWHHRVVGRD
jgi:hypothetical protein